jgi:hypothetical protein
MKNTPLYRVISVNPDGRFCIDNQVVDFDMILFEEQAKNLLEAELMEGPLNYYPGQEGDDSFFEENDLEAFGENDILPDDRDIWFGDGYYDINNDDFDIN